MEIIKTVEIRKFRSIKSLTSDLHPKDLNIFVGRNDEANQFSATVESQKYN